MRKKLCSAYHKMKLRVELTEKDLTRLVRDEIERRLGEVMFKDTDIIIEVKSKQNFKSEWEPAAFRATLSTSQGGA